MAVHLACQRHVGSKRTRGEFESGLTCMQISWRLLCADPLRVLRAIRLGACFGFSLTCRGSEWSLCADPLRVLRAIRFGARFGFRLDEELEHAAASEPVSHPPACTSWKPLMQSQDHRQRSVMVWTGPTATVSLLITRAVQFKLLLWSSIPLLLPFRAESMLAQSCTTVRISSELLGQGCLRLPRRSLRP